MKPMLVVLMVVAVVVGSVARRIARLPYPLNTHPRGGQVNPDVDSLARKSLHAAIVVRVSVNTIDAHCVGTDFLDQTGIDLALPGVLKGIGDSEERVRDAWNDDVMISQTGVLIEYFHDCPGDNHSGEVGDWLERRTHL